MHIIKNKPLVKNLVLVDGHTRTGKFFLGRILDGFDGVEHFQHALPLEHMSYLHKMGVIKQDVAVSLIQATVDEHAYHMRIGRNLNLRRQDASSLYKVFDRDRYLKRCFGPDGHQIVTEMNREKRKAVFVIHEAMTNIQLYFKAFAHAKVISILRHPIDLTYSWYQRGYGKREFNDPIVFDPCVELRGRSMPWYAFKWCGDYLKMSQVDRIIRGIYQLSLWSQKSYCELTGQKRKQILIITHEQLAKNPLPVIKKIGLFLGLRPAVYIKAVIQREKSVSREKSLSREDKSKFIQKRASKPVFSKLLSLASDYEKFSETNKWVQ